MKNLKNILTTLLLAFILINSLNAQTIANFKVEHNPSSLSGKIHLINTPDCNWINLMPTMDTFENSNHLVRLEVENNYSISLYDTITNRHNIYDTIATVSFTVSENFAIQYINGIDIKAYYLSNSNTIILNIGTLHFNDFIMSPKYLPCYVSVGPVLSIPTLKWESIENNAISKYIIKRNGQNIDTVNFASGILSYTDNNNYESINFMQTYSLEAIDSTGRSRSGDATTIHARNLASVNGNVELDWNIPTAAGTINYFDIYEYDATLDVLTLVNTVPSTITQYTITNPDITKMYIVGVPNVDCSSSAIRSTSTSLLSNSVQAIGTSGIQSLTIDRNDEVTGYFDLMGREIDANTINQILIIKYKSGKKIQKFIQQ